jgi:hypothetical protein
MNGGFGRIRCVYWLGAGRSVPEAVEHRGALVVERREEGVEAFG